MRQAIVSVADWRSVSSSHAKTKFILLSLLFLGIFFTSCKKPGDDVPPTPQPSYHLNLSQSSVQSPAAGTTANVSIEANAPWKLTLSAGADWLQVNKTSGDGNDALEVKVTKENTTGAKRSATISVELVNGKAPGKQIVVEQDFTIVNPLTVAWKKVLGGNGNDYGYSIIKTPDGGYLLSGRTTSNNGDITSTKGGIDMWIAKLDAAGAISWQKTYGGNSDEYSVSAAATPDGGYVLTGYTVSNNNGDVGINHGTTDFWVLKINGTGAFQWQKTLGGNGEDRPNAVTVTTEGRIAVAGYTSSNNNGDVGTNRGWEDAWVVVLENTTGAVVWKKTYGGNASDAAKAMVAAPDGGLFVGGTTASNNNGDVGASKGASDMWVLKLDKDGNIAWKNNYGGSNSEELYSLALTADNGLIAAGSTKSNNSGDVGPATGGEDMWIIRINAGNGALAWQKVLGGNAIDVAKGLLIRPNGNIVVAGYTYSNNSGDVEANHGSGDYWVVGLTSTGNLAWKKALGGDNEDLAFAIAEGEQGFVLAGYTLTNNNGDVGAAHGNSDIWVVKLKDQ